MARKVASRKPVARKKVGSKKIKKSPRLKVKSYTSKSIERLKRGRGKAPPEGSW